MRALHTRTQCIDLVEQIKCERDAGRVNLEVTCQPLRGTHATQGRATEAPLLWPRPFRLKYPFRNPKRQFFFRCSADPAQFDERELDSVIDNLSLQIARRS